MENGDQRSEVAQRAKRCCNDSEDSGLMDFRLRKWSTEGVKKRKLFEEQSSEFLRFSLQCSIFTEIHAAGGLSLFRFFLP